MQSCLLFHTSVRPVAHKQRIIHDQVFVRFWNRVLVSLLQVEPAEPTSEPAAAKPELTEAAASPRKQSVAEVLDSPEEQFYRNLPDSQPLGSEWPCVPATEPKPDNATEVDVEQPGDGQVAPSEVQVIEDDVDMAMATQRDLEESEVNGGADVGPEQGDGHVVADTDLDTPDVGGQGQGGEGARDEPKEHHILDELLTRAKQDALKNAGEDGKGRGRKGKGRGRGRGKSRGRSTTPKGNGKKRRAFTPFKRPARKCKVAQDLSRQFEEAAADPTWTASETAGAMWEGKGKPKGKAKAANKRKEGKGKAKACPKPAAKKASKKAAQEAEEVEAQAAGQSTGENGPGSASDLPLPSAAPDLALPPAAPPASAPARKTRKKPDFDIPSFSTCTVVPYWSRNAVALKMPVGGSKPHQAENPLPMCSYKF